MNPEFSWEPIGCWRALASRELQRRGLRHGFFGRQRDFSGCTIGEIADRLAEALEVDRVYFPTQVHGARVVDFREWERLEQLVSGQSDFGQADAVIAWRGHGTTSLALALQTADCMPIFMFTERSVAAVHCGWRGLERGILERVIDEMAKPDQAPLLGAVIGPCAGKARYLVGQEVVQAIGPSAVVHPAGGGKSFLALAESAVSVIRARCGAAVPIAEAELCTIESDEFHSYRRDGSADGRNISFIIG